MKNTVVEWRLQQSLAAAPFANLPAGAYGLAGGVTLEYKSKTPRDYRVSG